MKKFEIIRELKAELKRRAAEIRAVRKAAKERQRDPNAPWTGPKEFTPLWIAPSQYRHMHIAYCELRGRTREQIEPKVSNGNEPDEKWIEMVKEKGAKAFDNLYPNGGGRAIWRIDGTGWTHKVEHTRHLWDAEYAKLQEVKKELESFGRASLEHVSIGQFQKLIGSIRKLCGGK